MPKYIVFTREVKTMSYCIDAPNEDEAIRKCGEFDHDDPGTESEAVDFEITRVEKSE